MSTNAKSTSNNEKRSSVPKTLPKSASRTKIDTLIQHLKRPKGASILALCKATNWQSHSVRSALSRMHERGHKVVRTQDQGRVARYHIA